LRGLPENLLFTGPDIYDFVEDEQKKLKKAYEALPDEKALDEQFVVEFKQSFMLDVPTLKPDEWTSEQKQIGQHSIEVVAYIPFEGDPSVFNIRPSAMKGTVARGEIIGHELLIRVRQAAPQFDVPGYVKRELGEVQWHLESLRGSMEHMSQQLEITLRTCIQQRKRSIENRVQISENIGIPQRKKHAAAPEPPTPIPVPDPKHAPPKVWFHKTVQQAWDIFMSHASPDKPWVRSLVKALRANGVTVWFDEDSLEWGEDLQRGINRGLINSRKAIAVLSQSYLAERKWTEAEISGLLARETLGEILILPIWHGITEEDLKKYNLILASRIAKVSDSDNYDVIVQAVLKALDREQEIEHTDDAQTPTPARPQDGTDKRELVAYAWYEQKGPEAKRTKVYIRRSDFLPSMFVLIDGENEHDGSEQDVAAKFFMGDRYLANQGYTRTHFSNPSNIRAFDL
jgi:TIR domain